MSFSGIARNIIKETIQNVICIDDKFIKPYENYILDKEEEKERFEKNLGHKLYEEFEKRDCNINISRYESNNESLIKKINNNDLMILDWELEESKACKFEETLNLLDASLDTNISIICIYTHANFSNVSDILRSYYSEYTQVEVNEIYKTVEEILEEYVQEDLLENVDFKMLCQDFIEDKSVCKKLLNLTNKFLETDFKEIKEKCSKRVNVNRIFKALGFKFKNAYLSENETFNLKVVDESKYIYQINGKLIFIRNKEITQGEFSISVDNLYDEISEKIWEAPNDFLTLLWLEIKNYQKNTLDNSIDFLKNINESAFFNHRNKSISSNKELNAEEKLVELNDFIFNVIKEEINYNLLDCKSKTLENIEKYINEKGIDETKSNLNETHKLNHYISFNKKNSRNNNIRFGDVFSANDKFYICITAHCDCLKPKKIDDNFIFVEGEKCRISNDKNLDTDYISILNEKDSYFGVKWVDKNGKAKIIPAYIENNDIFNLKVIYRKEEVSFKYLGNQKENYTQRLANYAYSWMNRVGVSFSLY